MSVFPALLMSQTEPTAGCGNPAFVQVGALAGTAPQTATSNVVQTESSFGMVAQEDQQIASRIKDFMSSLHEAKAEWGMFHMLIAQAVLRRPIHLAQPVESAPYWHVEPINDIVGRYVWEDSTTGE